MIVKYFNSGAWGYVDHAGQAEVREFNMEEMVTKYIQEVKEGKRGDNVGYKQDLKMQNKKTITNIILTMINGQMRETIANLNVRTVNVLKGNLSGLYTVLIYVDECKTCDAVLLLTNQNCYLMNDEGKTIERLV